jgi:hypothetical protein
MATLNVPIPQDKIGECFVWRDWFQRLSNKVYGTMASQNANSVAITGGSISGTTIVWAPPSTKTANFTVADTDSYLINNKPAATCVVTFPAASLWSGRAITIKNLQAQLVNSATSNVVPLDGTVAGTAILLGVVGNWATLVSDGTNWVIMQAAPNNILLLE